jgi:circadian clock protein KaiB
MKKNNKKNSTTARFEKKAKETAKEEYVLRLYIAGMSTQSQRAIENITKICEESLKGRYELEIVDIYQQPHRASEAQIIAAPTLIKKLPLPLRKFIGNMADREKILAGLDLRPQREQ